MSEARVAAIVLAAGLSSRFGSFKPLAKLKGRTLIERVLDTLMASKAVEPIVVVTGHRAAELLLRLHSVTVTYNPDYANGEMLSSIKVGLRALHRDIDAAVLALCDQPMVEPRTIAALAKAW